MGRSYYSNIKVLIYHRVTAKDSNQPRDWHAVSADNFRKQLKMLEILNFTPITFEDYYLYQNDKLTLPKKPVILTFDDGHLDTFNVARVILHEFDMRAVIFAIGNRHLQYALWDHKDGEERLPLMRNEHLLQARAEGFEIGAHSMTHPTLPSLTKEEQEEEIQGSKKSLEALLGEEILSFAYPYGKLNKQVYEITKKAGYKFACGVYTGPAQFGDDIFNIRRLSVASNTGLFNFLLKLMTPYEYMAWLYYRFRILPKEQEYSSENTDVLSVDYDKTFRNKAEPN